MNLHAIIKDCPPTQRLVWLVHSAFLLALLSLVAALYQYPPLAGWITMHFSLGGLLIIVALSMRSQFRIWYLQNPRWWMIPSGLLLFCTLGIQGPPLLFDRPPNVDSSLPLLDVRAISLVAFLLYLFPRNRGDNHPNPDDANAHFPPVAPHSHPPDRGDSENEWRPILRRFLIPLFLIHLAILSSWYPTPDRRLTFLDHINGLSGLLAPIFLLHLFQIRRWIDRIPCPRLSQLFWTVLALTFLIPAPNLLFPEFPSTLFHPHLGWLFSIPCVVEILRTPAAICAILPQTPLENYQSSLVQLANSEEFVPSLIRTVLAGCPVLTNVFPFLFSLGLVGFCRSRFHRALGFLIASPLVFIALMNTWSLVYVFYYRTDVQAYSPLSQGLAGAITLVLGILVWTASDGEAQIDPLPPSWRRGLLYGVILTFLSAALSLIAMFIFGWRASRQFIPSNNSSIPTPVALLLNRHIRHGILTPGPSPNLINWAKSNKQLSEEERQFLEKEDRRLTPLLQTIQKINRLDLSTLERESTRRNPFSRRYNRGVYEAVRYLNYHSQLSLSEGKIHDAAEFTSTSLHFLTAVLISQNAEQNLAESYFGYPNSILEPILNDVKAATSTLERQTKALLLDAVLKSDLISSNQRFPLQTGTRSPYVRGFISYFTWWPARCLFSSKEWSNLDRQYSNLLTNVIRFHWIRTRTRILLFHDVTGRFPDNWAEVQKTLGSESADGVIPQLTVPFSRYLTITPVSPGQIGVAWTLPVQTQKEWNGIVPTMTSCTDILGKPVPSSPPVPPSSTPPPEKPR